VVELADGSHEPNHQYASISHLWPAVKSGGVYIIEVGARPLVTAMTSGPLCAWTTCLVFNLLLQDLAQHWWGNPERIDAWNDSMSDFKVVMPLYQRMIRTINW
jgi:hypothetical protein